MRGIHLLILSFFTFSSLSYGDSKYIDFDVLIKKDGLYYDEYDALPYTGEVTGRCQGKLKNGLFDGHWKFYRNNILSSETSFKDGIFHGIREVYLRDGRLGTKQCYQNGESMDLSVCESE